VKNFLAATLLSLGTPMLLMGDEIRRTQRGNNNAYAQDNPISWMDWSLQKKHGDVLRFVRLLIEGRLRLGVEAFGEDLSLNDILRRARIEWHGVRLGRPDWSDWSHAVAFTLEHPGQGFKSHTLLNAYWEPLTFELPPADGGWRRWIDTGLPSPEDIRPWSEAHLLEGWTYPLKARSMAVLLAGAEGARFSLVLHRPDRR